MHIISKCEEEKPKGVQQPALGKGAPVKLEVTSSMLRHQLDPDVLYPGNPHCIRGSSAKTTALIAMFLIIAGLFVYLLLVGPEVYSQARLPGTDQSDKLEAAGTVLRLLDTALFKWGARLFAGLCIMSSAWALKEQRFGIAVICIIGALIFGTAPKWVKNIFDIGGSDSVFGYTMPIADTGELLVGRFENEGTFSYV